MVWVVLGLGAALLLLVLLRGGRSRRWTVPLVVVLTGVVLTVWVDRLGSPVEMTSVHVVDDRSFQLIYRTGECERQSSVDVEERADSVTVTVRERTPSGPCSSVAVRGVASVRLDEPLGDRRVIDGSTGRELSTE